MLKHLSTLLSFGAAFLPASLAFASADLNDLPQRWAIAPIIAAALISAAAAAASGIAGAAGSAASADAASKDSEKSRRLQEKLAKMQLAEQQRQARLSQLGALQQTLGSSYQDAGQTQINRAAERQASRKGLIDSLSRTFLS